MTHDLPKAPFISCTGCGRDIYILFTDHRLIQCRKCGKKMHVLTLGPAGQENKASNL